MRPMGPAMTSEEKAAAARAEAEKKARQAAHRATLAAEERARILAALAEPPAESLLRMACSAWARWLEADELREAHGDYQQIRNAAGVLLRIVPCSHVAVGKEAAAEYQRLAKELGLGKARPSVEVEKPEPAAEVDAEPVGPVERFVADECEVAEGARAVCGKLWERFQAVAPDEEMSERGFFLELGKLGYTRGRSSAGRIRLGLRLKGGGPRRVVKFPVKRGAAADVEISAEVGPPAHLSPGAAAWWREVVEAYTLESHGLRTLTLAAEAWDEAQQARAELGEGGKLTIETPRGPKRHPLVMIRGDAQKRFVAHVRELGFDLEAGKGRENRPPRPTAARGKK